MFKVQGAGLKLRPPNTMNLSVQNVMPFLVQHLLPSRSRRIRERGSEARQDPGGLPEASLSPVLISRKKASDLPFPEFRKAGSSRS